MKFISYLESLLYPLGITIEQVDRSMDEGILFQTLKKDFKLIIGRIYLELYSGYDFHFDKN